MKPEASPEPPSSGLVSWNQAGVQLIAPVHRGSREFFRPNQTLQRVNIAYHRFRHPSHTTTHICQEQTRQSNYTSHDLVA